MSAIGAVHRGGTPSLLRSLNARTVLELIEGEGPISRAQIARRTGLSKPTVSLALNRLVDSGIAREVGRSSGSRGPAAILYRIDPRAGFVGGLDVGRGWLRAAVADLSGEIIARQVRRSTTRSAHALLDRIDELVTALLADAGVLREQIDRWVLGTSGVVRPGGLSLALATNLPGWGRPEVLSRLHEQFGDVLVENDVNLATLAEQRFGHGRGVADFVVVSIGTGVGMGLVLDGRLYRGAHGAAGEIGYLPVGSSSDRRGRRQGLLEAVTGADSVVREARALGLTGRLTAAKVFDAARSGDPIALRVVDAEADRIGFALASVVAVVDPELVVLGGGIGKSADLLLKRVGARLHALSPMEPQCVVSALGDDAVLRGALATGLDLAREDLYDKATHHPAQLTAAPA